jgi:hypothetical protein
LKKKKNFLIANWFRAEFSAAQPVPPHARGLRGPADRCRGPADSRARTA